MIKRVQYRKPPIIERALVVHTAISEESFQRKAEEWQSTVQRDFPHAETMTEWTLAVTEKDGMPVLDPTKQTMTIRQTFWQVSANKKEKGIQLWPDKVAFNLVGSPGNPRRFEELEELLTQWLPRWASHFEVSDFRGVTLEYVNLLSDVTLPSFVEGKRLKIGDAMTLFSHPTTAGHLLTAPFDFQINLIEEAKPQSRLTAHCFTTKAAGPELPEMQLRFRATTHLSDRKSEPLASASKEVSLMHELIIKQFDAYFTDRAKLSFEPL